MAPRNRNNVVRMRGSDSTYTRAELRHDFPDDATCLEWLWKYLYADVRGRCYCITCKKATKHHRVLSRPSYSCDYCGHHVHPTAGTIFEKSSTSLALWFEAIYLMSSSRCGVSAKHLERELGVTYKTAWRMFHQIRKLLVEDATLGGAVEIDEMFVGGRKRWRGRSTAQKTAVFGMVERGGRVVAKVVEHTGKLALMPHIQARVLPKTMIYSDEWRSYYGLRKLGYPHRRIHHLALLELGQARYLRCPPRSQPEVSPNVFGRVRLPVQPPE
jgi:transposase-like protein